MQTLKQVGTEILGELKQFNKQVWDAVSFRLIHAKMSNEKSTDSYAKTKEYRRERWEKALDKAEGNKRKAYELLSSEKFY